MPSPSEYRALAEEASASAVAGGSSKASTFVKVLVPIGAVAIAGWMVWSATRSPTRPSLTASDTEEFRTTQFPAPALSTPRPQDRQKPLGFRRNGRSVSQTQVGQTFRQASKDPRHRLLQRIDHLLTSGHQDRR